MDETLDLGDLTALIGANGAGKSSFLRALQYFYDGPANVTAGDFYDRDTSEPIEVEVTFADLAESEAAILGPWTADGLVKVLMRVTTDHATGRPQARYHGFMTTHRPFQEVRASGNASAKQDALARLRDSDPALYDWTRKPATWAQAEAAMRNWEASHPGSLEVVEDDGATFKAPHSGGPLAQYTQLILVLT